MRKSSILFLCNQKRCENCSGKIMPDGCKHTSDVTYAKNKAKVMKFKKEFGEIYVEVEE